MWLPELVAALLTDSSCCTYSKGTSASAQHSTAQHSQGHVCAVIEGWGQGFTLQYAKALLTSRALPCFVSRLCWDVPTKATESTTKNPPPQTYLHP